MVTRHRGELVGMTRSSARLERPRQKRKAPETRVAAKSDVQPLGRHLELLRLLATPPGDDRQATRVLLDALAERRQVDRVAGNRRWLAR